MKSNITDRQEVHEQMLDTLKDLVMVLKEHCGPMGRYAVITDPHNPMAEPVFTKDGINIVRSIKYDDRISEFTRSSLEYIGSRIETSAGDGTTSAMLICANMLKVLLEEISKSKCILSNTEYTVVYDKVKSMIMKEYDKRFTPILEHVVKDGDGKPTERYMKAIRNISYWQAYTSSHGDVELSKSISELFTNTPIEAWDNIVLESSRYETSFRYGIEVDDAQYTLVNVRPFPVSQMKQELGLSCNREKSRTIISKMAPCLAIVDTAPLIKKIDDAIVNGEELTVICPDDFKDAPTLYHFDELFNQHPDHKVVIMLVHCRDQLNDILGAYTLGIPGRDEEGEHHLTYRFSAKDSCLRIMDGLYPETTNVMYPYTDVQEYKELLSQVKEVLKGLKDKPAQQGTAGLIKHVQKFLMKLTVIKRHSLLLGGASYDNVTAVDVAIDALSATKKSLTKGFVLGGNKSLYKVCQDLLEDDPQDEPDYYLWFYKAVLKAIMSSIETVYECIYSNAGVKSNRISHEYSENVLDRERRREEFNENIIYLDTLVPVIIQPKTMDLELVSRFGEVALKFLSIDKIIARG
jgi:hypothetical protein